MAATPSIKIVKTVHWKGNIVNWSNRYHFAGGTPADNSHWTTLADAIVTAEKACIHDSMQIVQAVGYGAGSDVPVFSKTYTTTGTLTSDASNIRSPAECAALIKFTTTQRTSKNHPVYLFNYMHSPLIDIAGYGDTMLAHQTTPYATYFSSWLTGFSDGANTYTRAGPNGAVAQTRVVETYVTHRDFRR